MKENNLNNDTICKITMFSIISLFFLSLYFIYLYLDNFITYSISAFSFIFLIVSMMSLTLDIEMSLITNVFNKYNNDLELFTILLLLLIPFFNILVLIVVLIQSTLKFKIN